MWKVRALNDAGELTEIHVATTDEACQWMQTGRVRSVVFDMQAALRARAEAAAQRDAAKGTSSVQVEKG